MMGVENLRDGRAAAAAAGAGTALATDLAHGACPFLGTLADLSVGDTEAVTDNHERLMGLLYCGSPLLKININLSEHVTIYPPEWQVHEEIQWLEGREKSRAEPAKLTRR